MSAGMARAFGSLARGLAGGIQLGSQLDAQKERTQALKDANNRTKAQDKAFAELADLAEGYVGGATPAVPKPSGPAAFAAGGIGREPMPVDAPAPAATSPAVTSAQAPQQQGPKTPEQRLGFALYRQPALLQSREFFDKAAAIMLRTPGMGQDGLRWLLRGAQLQKENGIEALKKLAAGDAQGAEAAFQASGDMKLEPGSLKPLEGGKWQATIAGTGQVRTFDPLAELRMTLNPKDYFELAAREGKANAEAANRDRTFAETKRHNEATEKTAARNADLKLDLARIRGERGHEAATALERNLARLVKIGAAKTEAEAFTMLRESGAKPEREGIAALAKVLLSRPGYFGRDGAAKAITDATGLYRSIGAQPNPQPASPPAPGAPRTPGAGPAVAPAGAFKSADDVRAAFRAGRLPRDQAESILRDQFGYGQ